MRVCCLPELWSILIIRNVIILFKKISGCGVALKLIMSLRKSLRDSGWWTAERPEPNLRDILDLAALGTVADVMPLVDENRILTHHGLRGDE